MELFVESSEKISIAIHKVPSDAFNFISFIEQLETTLRLNDAIDGDQNLIRRIVVPFLFAINSFGAATKQKDKVRRNENRMLLLAVTSPRGRRKLFLFSPRN